MRTTQRNRPRRKGFRGPAPERPGDPDERSVDVEEPLAYHCQTTSEIDRTLSDADRILSDTNQTLSESDQQVSDEDEAASDRALDHGRDPEAHERTTAIRAATSRKRRETGGLRNQIASERDSAAEGRDELAARRDQLAEIADEKASRRDRSDALLDRHSVRAAQLRGRGASTRRRAAADRERAAQDRARARRDRELAARNREQAARERERAETDELTGVRRRGVGLDELEREIQRARRTGAGLIAAYVDVDGLKSINDMDGHSAGDQVLRDVAAGLTRQMRSYDLVGRLGGDEFLCALPGVTLIEARRRFDRLGAELRADPPIRSVTVGFSELRDGDSAQELIDRADRDLLAARTSDRPNAAARAIRASY